MSRGDWVGNDYRFSFPVLALDKRSLKDNQNQKVHSQKVKRGEMSDDWAVGLSANSIGFEGGKAEQLFEGY